MKEIKVATIIGIIFTILVFSKIAFTFPMECENSNSPKDVVKGVSIDFRCTSTRKFHSCILERTGADMKSVHCNFTFYTPSSFFGSPGQKQLQKVGWDCDLDKVISHRIQIMNKYNEKRCHIKIDSSDVIGKHLQKKSILLSIIIRLR